MTDNPLSAYHLDELYRALCEPSTPLSSARSASYPGHRLADLLTAPPPGATLWGQGMSGGSATLLNTLLGVSSAPSPTIGAASMLGLLNPPPAPVTLLSGLPSSQPWQPPRWIAVRQRFTEFHQNLSLTALQTADGARKRDGVVSCLNQAYYGSNSGIEHSFFVGSWGKETATRPPRDVDVYFVLPPAAFHRFQARLGNRQSALLQEVKEQLVASYPDTMMSGDGQVVVVDFGSYCVEVVPAFELTTPSRYWICNTHDGGSYKETAPWHEIVQLAQADEASAGNLCRLIRMLKAWQAWCAVPIKSFHLELLATEFISRSPWRLKDFFWFDWLIRDFFLYLCGRVNGSVVVPGTGEVMPLGEAWYSRADSAYQRAVKACEYEENNRIEVAGEEWQKIFGIEIPREI